MAIDATPGPVTDIVINTPPVNALAAAEWHELALAVRRAGEDPETRAVVLSATGRGFNAGVDVTELDADPARMVEVNRACFAAFAAVYECAVPVIVAVHGYCLGGGVGLVGNADVVLASHDAYFGLPEVDRGALGAATHLARLVPQHLARAMLYTCRTVTADELHRYGSVLQVTSRAGLRESARELAEQIAAKDPYVIRRAKEALNGIDPTDVRRSYRFEQGLTFELTLMGKRRGLS